MNTKPTNDTPRSAPSRAKIRRVYEAYQPDAPVAVREYILTEHSGERCCLMSWILKADIAVDRFCFSILPIDENGMEGDAIEIAYSRDDLPPLSCGQSFTPPWAIPVPAYCTAIRVCLHEVASGDYLYRVTPAGVIMEYNAPIAWVYDRKAARRDGLGRRESLRVASKLGRPVRGLWPVALLALLVVAIVISWPYLARILPLDAVRNFLLQPIRQLLEKLP